MPASITQRPPVLQDLAGGIVPGYARYPAARVRRRSALVETPDQRAVVGVMRRRPMEEQLFEREFPVKEVAMRCVDDPLDLRGQQQLFGNDAVAEAGRKRVDRDMDVLQE